MREGTCIEDVIEGRSEWIVVRADCRFALAGIPPDCIDACVCDPPYGLSEEPNIREVLQHWLNGDDYEHRGGGFMGKKWDSFVPGPAYWEAVARVLKPGAHLAAFGGKRTYDLMTTAIRFARFECRDSIDWIYGTGFPKSLNVSLAMDKSDGVANQREVVHSYTASGNAGTSTKDKGGTYVTGAPNSDPVTLSVTRGATEKSRKCDGFGTALKPAAEPIVIARKPLDGTVIGNVEKYGTGALNIDACRVPTDWDEPDRPDSWKRSGHTADADAEKIAAPPGDGIQCHPGGRWPPNVLMDSEMAGVLGEQSGGGKSSGGVNADGFTGSVMPFGGKAINASAGGLGDSGTAARFFPILDYDDKLDAPFFYCAKASTAEREAGLDAFPVRTAGQLTGRKEGSAGLTPRAGAGRASKGRRNLHTTVKPVALLSWLIRLVTPPGGIVIDPFCGSGSAGIAATLQGFRYIGIELDPDNEGHVEIARARIRYWLKHGGPVKQSAPPRDPEQSTLSWMEQ